ncbi:MAG TPA: hypothetical protein DEP46_01605 [Blastocatellia bacterium]|nr:hypothetical protein [Blastocatellia bacterium]
MRRLVRKVGRGETKFPVFRLFKNVPKYNREKVVVSSFRQWKYTKSFEPLKIKNVLDNLTLRFYYFSRLII